MIHKVLKKKINKKTTVVPRKCIIYCFDQLFIYYYYLFYLQFLLSNDVSMSINDLTHNPLVAYAHQVNFITSTFFKFI